MGWLKRWLLAACLSPFRLFTQVIYFIPQCKQRSAVVFFLTTVYLSQNAVTSGEVLPTKTDYTTDVKFSSHNVLFLPAHQILILRAGWMILCRNRVNSIGALIGTGVSEGTFPQSSREEDKADDKETSIGEGRVEWSRRPEKTVENGGENGNAVETGGFHQPRPFVVDVTVSTVVTPGQSAVFL